jgi:hypothetical protein
MSKASVILATIIFVTSPPTLAQADVKTKGDRAAQAEKAKSSGEMKDKDVGTILNETKLTYPELEVTPRASERIELEAKYEAKNRWYSHLPIQFSALMTLIATSSATAKDSLSPNQLSDFNNARTIAECVGVGWLALTVALSAAYRPYFAGYRDIAKMPASNPREELTRERIAEEALYAPEDFAIKLKWFSVVSNAAANIAVMVSANTSSETLLTAAALSSMAPLLFEYRWVRIADQHRIYKKKIYGPLSEFRASSILMTAVNRDDRASAATAVGEAYSPGLGLLWTF